jgi:hypothetical protein
MLDPKKLHEFLSRLSIVEQGEPVSGDNIHRAMKHFVLPLTSEFYGFSMAALQEMLASNRMNLSDEDRRLAANFVKEIQQKWFKPLG